MNLGKRRTTWRQRLAVAGQALAEPVPLEVEGRLTRMVGLTLEAVGCEVPVGGRCQVLGAGGLSIEAEVVGFSGEKTYLMPTGDLRGLVPGARVVPRQGMHEAQVGPQLLGRIIDGGGRPLDGKGPLRTSHRLPLGGVPLNPLERKVITEPLDVGVRAINALLTVGRGQRLGLFAGAGVGKSVLLGMMTRFTKADVIVVGLIGERGREVKDFIEHTLGPEGLRRAVVVAAPADYPPLIRLHGAMLATTIAEFFRNQGKNVLLLMDSMTRFAQAQREIALAIGEPPATKGYPPSVFTKLPQLAERAGNSAVSNGSITAFYTVLAEGDDQNDPIADAARAILDGHIVLSRRIADSGLYPAIDIEASISRVMTEIVQPAHLQAVRTVKHNYSTYEENRDLISVGAYQAGTDAQIDQAIAHHPRIMEFLSQDMNQPEDFNNSLNKLIKLSAV